MEAEPEGEELISRALEKIDIGHELIAELDNFKFTGVQKIQRKINQEVKFLQKTIKNGSLKVNHVQCTNLTHYEFLVKLIGLQKDILCLDCGFAVEGRSNPLRVDIVCDNGLKWIKAIARNSKSLSDAAKGEASYGVKSIVDQAAEYVNATKLHLCMFQRPKVVFYFSHRIQNDLLEELLSTGVECASLTEPVISSSNADYSSIGILNLDITTLLSYVSSVCNGGCNWVFREKILTEQAEKERQTPLKPVLDQLFQNKRLICCVTAHKSFEEIIKLLAGPKERERAAELMNRVEILPDTDKIPNELSTIKLSGRINERSLKIFSFGMQMKALTVTSNKAFVRSAKMQGINVPVFTHQARALTEAKENTATPLSYSV